jgi:hypothetical protein
MRYLGIMRGDKNTEAGAPPSPEMMGRMDTFIEEVAKAGVLLGTEGLHPSARAKRVRLHDGKPTVIDGPFTETKETIASYALFQTATIEEAVHWTQRFLQVLGEGECDIYPIFEAADFGPDAFTPEQRAQDEQARAQMAKNAATA